MFILQSQCCSCTACMHLYTLGSIASTHTIFIKAHTMHFIYLCSLYLLSIICSGTPMRKTQLSSIKTSQSCVLRSKPCCAHFSPDLELAGEKQSFTVIIYCLPFAKITLPLCSYRVPVADSFERSTADLWCGLMLMRDFKIRDINVGSQKHCIMS